MRLKEIIVFIFFFLSIYSCNKSSKRNNSNSKEIEYAFTNALVNETSPYLLQHAHNPVDWRSWSKKVLDDAKKENKLLVISIGYSSCHWCHVMEKETFSDEEVAKLMNDNFINIKVDREERPDIDNVYMTAVQLMNGSGGWPLSVIALPNGKPLYGGTYHSKEQWKEILSQINDLYLNNPKKAQQYANNLTKGIQEVNQTQVESRENDLSQKDLAEILSNSKSRWDTIWGGNLGSEKFMLPTNLDFLLDYGTLKKDSSVLKQLKLTLDNIANKGVYDHIEGGFFRYSTDKKWQVPHFEKMLYDNAQLMSTYSKAYKVYKDPLYKEVVLKTIDFLNNTFKSKSDAYFSSLDAGLKEGEYYLWSRKELNSIITENFELFKSYYAINKEYELVDNKYHLFKYESDEKFAKRQSLKKDNLLGLKSTWNKKLSEARHKKKLPNIDDKIIVSWNALLIIGLVDAYSTFRNEDNLQLAISTFETLKSKAFSNDRLVHSYKPNSKKIDGFLEDYAFLQKAALKLFFFTTDEKYFRFAEKLNSIIMSEFSNNDEIMFTYSNNQGLISKIVKTDEGVMPSANSVMAENLFYLGLLKDQKEMSKRSEKMLNAIANYSKEQPSSFGNWNSLFLKMTLPFYEVAVVGEDAKIHLLDLGGQHNPNAIVVGTSTLSNKPLFKNRFVESETYIYVCKDKTCKLPVKNSEAAIKQLNSF